MGHREVTFLPQLVSAHAFAPRDAHKRDDPSAIAPSPALQGPARGLEQVSLSLPIPWHQLGLNFQLLQNKFPGGCTWSWHCAEMPVCLSSAVSVWWGLWGWGSARHAAGCGRLPAAVCGTGIDRGVISLLPRMSAHKCICSALDSDLLPWSIFPPLSQGSEDPVMARTRIQAHCNEFSPPCPSPRSQGSDAGEELGSSCLLLQDKVTL